MSYYIGRWGHIFEWESKSDREAPLDTSSLGFENKFEDKERAYFFRDNMRKYHPRAFIKDIQPKKKPMSNKALSQEDFQEEMRKTVSNHIDEFWTNLSKLAPKDFVDGWLKAAQFGFSKAPQTRVVDDDERQRQAEKEKQRKEDLISRGIVTEDMED